MKKKLLLIPIFIFAVGIMNAEDNMALQITADGTWFECASFMDFTTTDVTFEAWVKLDGTITVDDYTAVVDCRYGDLSNSKALIFKTINTKLTTSFEWEGAWGFEDTDGLNEVQVDTWQHIAVVVDGTSKIATFYVNGNAGATQAAGADATSYGNIGSEVFWDTVFIGGGNATDNRTVIGVIDEIRIWNVARSASEIADNMAMEIDPSTSGLIAYYRCNEDASSTSLTDASGNGNDAQVKTDKTDYAFINDDDWVAVSIKDKKIENITIFPNPVQDKLSIKGVNLKGSEVKIYNITGQIVQNSIATDYSLNVNNLSQGVYYIEINTDNQQYCTKFIKK